MHLRKTFYQQISFVSIALVSALLFQFPALSESTLTSRRNPSSLISSNPSSQNIFESEYKDLLNLSIEIFTRFPPDKYFILGIGRSPDSIIAQLQLFNPQYADRIPGSGLKQVEAARKTDPNYPQYRDGLSRSFDLFFPATVVKNRTIIIIDYGWTGVSLEVMTYYLERWSLRKDVPFLFQNLLLVEPNPEETTGYRNAVNNPHLKIDYRIDMRKYSHFGKLLKYSALDGFAYYPAFYPYKKQPEFLRMNPAYWNLQAEIKSKFEEALKTDPTIMERLSGTKSNPFRNCISLFGF